MGKTSIEWTDHSWPIVNGCRRISPGCESCYAERLISTRLSKQPKYAGLAVYGDHGPRWTGESRLWVPHLDMPLKLRKPSRIFVADMGDLFYEKVTNEEIAAVFGVMAAAPRHTFQVLTKRPERMAEWFLWIAEHARQNALAAPDDPWWPVRDCLGYAGRILGREPQGGASQNWPLRNVWIGVSVENQEYADARIPVLLEIPAAVRFLSIEPQLGPVDLTRLTIVKPRPPNGPGVYLNALTGHVAGPDEVLPAHVDWVIVGGESGPAARPFDLEWAYGIAAQCKVAGVPIFYKQGGAGHACEHSRKGGCLACMPTDLALAAREFPR